MRHNHWYEIEKEMNLFQMIHHHSLALLLPSLPYAFRLGPSLNMHRLHVTQIQRKCKESCIRLIQMHFSRIFSNYWLTLQGQTIQKKKKRTKENLQHMQLNEFCFSFSQNDELRWQKDLSSNGFENSIVSCQFFVLFSSEHFKTICVTRIRCATINFSSTWMLNDLQFLFSKQNTHSYRIIWMNPQKKKKKFRKVTDVCSTIRFESISTSCFG